MKDESACMVFLSAPLKTAPFNEPEQAKTALQEVLERAKAVLPNTHLLTIGLHDRPFHDCDPHYLRLLLQVKKDLKQKRWNAACTDLQDVLHFFQIEDGRVINEIVHLLEENGG